MDAVDMSLHFIAVGLSACSLYCFFKIFYFYFVSVFLQI